MADQVRRAAKCDVETLALLNHDVQKLHASLYPRDFKHETDASVVADFFIRLLEKNEHVVLIHEGVPHPSGYIWFEVQQRPETPFTPAVRRIFIHHLSVRNEARRGGVASALMSWAEKYAHAEGIEEMLVDHWTQNDAARAFFSNLDFATLREVRRKRLSSVR